jgi:hypothetical protein
MEIRILTFPGNGIRLPTDSVISQKCEVLSYTTAKTSKVAKLNYFLTVALTKR